MMKIKNSGKTGCLRKILYVAGSIASIFLLFYGTMWILSLVGRQSIMVDGMERKYRVHLPAGYDAQQDYPLVVALHMYSGTARTMQWISKLNPAADQHGFIIVYAEGYQLSWAEGSNAYAADKANIDDVAFISDLIDRIITDYPIDPERVYAVGFSSGGLMVQRLGCELSEKIHGIATVGATLTNNVIEECKPEKPISVLMINGDADQGVPYQGNSLYASVEETMQLWVKSNNCASEDDVIHLPNVYDDGTEVIVTGYTDCTDNQTMKLYTIQGGGHTWPGGSNAAQLWGLNGKISREISASEIILNFFANILPNNR